MIDGDTIGLGVSPNGLEKHKQKADLFVFKLVKEREVAAIIVIDSTMSTIGKNYPLPGTLNIFVLNNRLEQNLCNILQRFVFE